MSAKLIMKVKKGVISFKTKPNVQTVEQAKNLSQVDMIDLQIVEQLFQKIKSILQGTED